MILSYQYNPYLCRTTCVCIFTVHSCSKAHCFLSWEAFPELIFPWKVPSLFHTTLCFPSMLLWVFPCINLTFHFLHLQTITLKFSFLSNKYKQLCNCSVVSTHIQNYDTTNNIIVKMQLLNLVPARLGVSDIQPQNALRSSLIFCSPFIVKNVQFKIRALQCDSDLKDKFASVGLDTFNQYLFSS